MKLNISQKILSSNNKPILFKEEDNSKIIEKEMTVNDVLNISLINLPNTIDEDILDNIDVLNRKLIKANIKNKKYIEINSKLEKTFIIDIIKNDIHINNIIKSFVLGMINNDGNVNL